MMNPFKKDKKQLSIFITAGYPKRTSLNEQLAFLAEKEIDFIEVGIPFSDPLADGPVIQNTSSIAIENGMNVKEMFDQLAQSTCTVPIVLMGYLNPVISFGMESFLSHCEALGISSVILPDLSIEIYMRNYQHLFEKFGITPAFIVTPTSTNERILLTAKLCENSFVYLVSSNSTTGASKNEIHAHRSRYKEIKLLCGDTPLFIGFGIRTKEDLVNAQQYADGGIIGSSYLMALGKGTHLDYIEQLMS